MEILAARQKVCGCDACGAGSTSGFLCWRKIGVSTRRGDLAARRTWCGTSVDSR